MRKIKKILLVPPLALPIPAVGGGAIEQLITYLLEENERCRRVKFVVISKHDDIACKAVYRHSSIYYFQSDSLRCNELPLFPVFWKLYNVWLKLFRNHLVCRLIPEKSERMTPEKYLCYLVAKKERVDGVSFEGRWDELNYDFLSKFVNKSNIYTHLHCARPENLTVRHYFPNSISISNYVRSTWVQDTSIAGKNLVVFNCADIEKFRFRFSDSERNAFRNALGVSSDDLLLLFCGRLIPEKGVKELLDAMSLLKNRPVKLLLIGSSGFSSKGTIPYEQSICERCKNNPAIIQLGYIPNHELPRYYAASDVQIIPTTCQEGAGLVAIEGMSAGLPLIATQSGGMVEYMDQDCAIQLEIDQRLPQNIASSVIELMENPQKRTAMSIAGEQRAAKYSPRAFYDGFVEIFR